MTMALEHENCSQQRGFAIKPISPVRETIFNIAMGYAQGVVLGSLAQVIIPDQAIGRSFGAQQRRHCLVSSGIRPDNRYCVETTSDRLTTDGVSLNESE